MDESERKFLAYNWDADEDWQLYKQNLTFPPGVDENQVVDRFKKKYYQRRVDPNYIIKEPSPTQERRNTSGASSTSSYASSASSSSSSSSSSSTNSGSAPTMQRLLGVEGIWLAANMLLLLHIVLYLLSFGSGSYTYYRRAMYLAALNYAISLYLALGPPQFNMQWATRAIMNDNAHYLILTLLFANAYPLTYILIPLAIYTTYHLINYLKPIFTAASSPFLRTLVPYFDKLLGYQQQALFWAAYTEFMAMPLLILNFFSGHGDLLSLFGYYQFLKFRYLFSHTTKRVMDGVGLQLDSLFSHPVVPPFLRGIWGKLRAFLRSTVQPPQQQ